MTECGETSKMFFELAFLVLCSSVFAIPAQYSEEQVLYPSVPNDRIGSNTSLSLLNDTAAVAGQNSKMFVECTPAPPGPKLLVSDCTNVQRYITYESTMYTWMQRDNPDVKHDMIPLPWRLQGGKDRLLQVFTLLTG